MRAAPILPGPLVMSWLGLGSVSRRGHDHALLSVGADAQAVPALVGAGRETLEPDPDKISGQTGRSHFLGAHGRGGLRGLHDQRGTLALEHEDGVTGPNRRAGMALTVRAIYPFPVLRHADKKGGGGAGGLLTGQGQLEFCHSITSLWSLPAAPGTGGSSPGRAGG